MGITRKQKQVYDFIVDHIETHGISPTQGEIQEHFQFKSLGSVQDYIRYLVKAGMLRNDSNTTRGLEPVIEDQSFSVPFYGTVAAGLPIEAIEDTNSIEIPPHMLKGKSPMALKVSGSSMIEDGILDGDIIIIDKKDQAKNGETVVALVNHEATLKKYFKKSHHIELHPANSSMEPIIVSNGDFRILGTLIGLIRNY